MTEPIVVNSSSRALQADGCTCNDPTVPVKCYLCSKKFQHSVIKKMHHCPAHVRQTYAMCDFGMGPSDDYLCDECVQKGFYTVAKDNKSFRWTRIFKNGAEYCFCNEEGLKVYRYCDGRCGATSVDLASDAQKKMICSINRHRNYERFEWYCDTCIAKNKSHQQSQTNEEFQGYN